MRLQSLYQVRCVCGQQHEPTGERLCCLKCGTEIVIEWQAKLPEVRCESR